MARTCARLAWNSDAAGPQPNKVYTFNSTELRAIDVAMQPVTPIGGAPLDEIGHEARPVRSAGQRGEAARRQRTLKVKLPFEPSSNRCKTSATCVLEDLQLSICFTPIPPQEQKSAFEIIVFANFGRFLEEMGCF